MKLIIPAPSADERGKFASPDSPMNKPCLITRISVAGLLTGALFTAGCDGSDINLNFVVPVGLGGTPGLLNPFGITQAFVNAWLNSVLPSGSSSSSSSSTGTTTGSASPNPDDPGVLGAVVNQSGT